jgi:hypothetical protein
MCASSAAALPQHTPYLLTEAGAGGRGDTKAATGMPYDVCCSCWEAACPCLPAGASRGHSRIWIRRPNPTHRVKLVRLRAVPWHRLMCGAQALVCLLCCCLLCWKLLLHDTIVGTYDVGVVEGELELCVVDYVG